MISRGPLNDFENTSLHSNKLEFKLFFYSYQLNWNLLTGMFIYDCVVFVWTIPIIYDTQHFLIVLVNGHVISYCHGGAATHFGGCADLGIERKNYGFFLFAMCRPT